MLEEAINRANQQPVGTEFEVKDLFLLGAEWKDALSAGEKTQLGRMFSNAFENKRIPNIIRIDVKKGKPNKYRKI